MADEPMRSGHVADFAERLHSLINRGTIERLSNGVERGAIYGGLFNQLPPRVRKELNNGKSNARKDSALSKHRQYGITNLVAD